MNKYFIYYELIHGMSEVVYKDSFVFETCDLNSDVLHKKKIEIKNKFRECTNEHIKFADVVFVNIVKL